MASCRTSPDAFQLLPTSPETRAAGRSFRVPPPEAGDLILIDHRLKFVAKLRDERVYNLTFLRRRVGNELQLPPSHVIGVYRVRPGMRSLCALHTDEPLPKNEPLFVWVYTGKVALTFVFWFAVLGQPAIIIVLL